MLNNFRNGRWFIASAFVAASCSQGDASRITSPTGAVTRVSITDGGAGASADGDVKTGPGALELIRLRMDRQTPGGASILRQYALPGVTYFMNPGETIELWAEWDPDQNLVPTVIPANPNMTVDWGAGQGTTDTNCGSCRLTHAYPDPGVYKVVVTLNDRNGTRVSRTFYLNSDSAPSDCGASASTSVFFGDEDDSDSSDFNDAETDLLGPVDGANTVSFTCVDDGDEAFRVLGAGMVRSHGDSEDSCFGHSHDGPVVLSVEVHNADTNAWTQVLSQPVDNGQAFIFNGVIGTFPRQKVDRVRVLSNPGQNQTYHGWGGASVTVGCQP